MLKEGGAELLAEGKVMQEVVHGDNQEKYNTSYECPMFGYDCTA